MTFCVFLMQARILRTVYRECRSTSQLHKEGFALVGCALKTQLHCGESALCEEIRRARIERKINTSWHYIFT